MCPDRCARFALLTLFANLHCFPFWWYIQNYLRSLDIPWDLLRSDVENVDNVDKINTVGNVGIASEHWWTIWSNMRQKLTKSWKLSISTTLQTLWNVHNWRYGYVNNNKISVLNVQISIIYQHLPLNMITLLLITFHAIFINVAN